MSAAQLPIGCLVRIDKPALQAVLDKLLALGYRVVGPTVSESAVVYTDLRSIQQMPIGYIDEQEAGKYRLVKTSSTNYFDYVVGPHSLKNFLFPPKTTLLETIRIKGSWQMQAPPLPEKPLAYIGARACELHALRVQDRVFLEGPYVDPDYEARRRNLFVLAVNCARAASTCFCTSMNTGPDVASCPGADLSLFELADHFVIQVGSERGGEVIAAAPWRPCSIREVVEAQQVPRRAEAQIRRRLDTHDIRNLLLDNLEHERWGQVAERCLACTNCTMVCPTCFCSSVNEVSDLSGDHARRERLWGSCFTDDHSYMNSGTIRKSTRARYRQWLTHKLATWIDQFGTSGCVGCGRCITWCPVGIDITEEVAAIRGKKS
jgi:formate hydrogenlyase subunit 6/NADH:ubiquinone oxidoreductase subunit I